MLRINYLLVGLISVLVAEINAIPAYIKPCKAVDKECIRANAEAALPYFVAGIPELGINKMEPAVIDSVKSEQPGLNFGFSNLAISGVGQCKIIELERDTTKNTIKLIAECPVHLIGQYHMKGKLLLFETYGDGDVEINAGRVRFTVEVNIKDIEKAGKKYWKITSFDYTYELLDKVDINLTNLYNGDAKKAEPVLAAIKENSNELVQEIGGAVIRKLISIYVEGVKKFLLSYPIDELELA